MKVIGHEDDVIDHFGDLGNGELLEVPVRGGSSDGNGLPWQQTLEDAKELEVIRAVILVAGRDARNIGFLNVVRLMRLLASATMQCALKFRCGSNTWLSGGRNQRQSV